jgi:hypothetical protein
VIVFPKGKGSKKGTNRKKKKSSSLVVNKELAGYARRTKDDLDVIIHGGSNHREIGNLLCGFLDVLGGDLIHLLVRFQAVCGGPVFGGELLDSKNKTRL